MVMNVKKNRHNAGFTMVELLTVVAILVILMGVSAVAVIRYQRNLHLKEMDSIAKEIFVAAQNHLSAADSQNLLSSYATSTDGSGLGYADGETNYIICTGGNVAGGSSALEQILPFGSIDETTRSNGSFILHYNKKSARVLDVFYATKNGRRYGHDLKPSDYNELKEEEYHGDSSNQREKRKHYSENGASNAVIGWYGGDDLGTTVETYLAEPVIQVDNGDKLTVTVTNFAALTGKSLSVDSKLSLIVSGSISGAMKQIQIAVGMNGGNQQKDPDAPDYVTTDGLTNVVYIVTLDDITTQDRHFAEVMQGGSAQFKPGEDIEVWAVAYDNSKLSNIAESGRVIVNSLYDSAAVEDTTHMDVKISSLRHLENLDEDISGVKWSRLATDAVSVVNVQQLSDLDWNTFTRADADATTLATPNNVRIHKLNESVKNSLVNAANAANPGVNPLSLLPLPGSSTGEDEGKFHPVTVAESKMLNYDGQSHSIRNITVNVTDGAAGLFTAITTEPADAVKDLNLVNFNISGTGKVGALAGSVSGSITNVAVYNDITSLTATDDSLFEITSTGGSVGGLAGEFFGGTANGCAAAVYVSGGTSTGGLFGQVGKVIKEEGKPDVVLSGTVQKSYSGGHTGEGCYKLNSTPVKKPNDSNKVIGYTYTVVTDGNARLNIQGSITGGLIGTLSVGTVTDCYSTCSVGGTMAGGFVGSAANGTTISNSYCTGLVTVRKESGGAVTYEMFSDPTTQTTIGTFAGSSSATLTSNHYLDIVNHRNVVPVYDTTNTSTIIKFEPAKDADQMKELGSSDTTGVSAIDESADSYNSFIVTGEKPSLPYDASLKANASSGLSYVKDGIAQYGFKPILVKNKDGNDVPLLHHGDWPIYETLVINS